MREQDLIDLGFERVDIEDYGDVDHYYNLDIGDITLITHCQSEVRDGAWFVEMFNSETLRVYDRQGLEDLIHILNVHSLNHSSKSNTSRI